MPYEIDDGPFPVAVLFCDKALREADGVLSLIRVVDKWTVTGPAELMPMTVIQTTVVVMLKSGIHRGNGMITLTPITPSGVEMPPIAFSGEFEGDNDRSLQASFPIGFPVQEAGPYWFELKVDGRLLARTAIRVTYLRVPPVAQQ